MNSSTLGLVITAALALSGCAGGEKKTAATNPNDKFKEFELPNDKVEARWCLNDNITIVQPERGDTWPNSGKVELSRIPVATHCQMKKVFEVGDRLYFSRAGVGMRLTIKDKNGADKNPKIDQITLTPDSPSPPRFWSNTAGPIDYFVMLQEKINSNGKHVKYYRIEAFDDNDTTQGCENERPDHADALVRLTGDATCPSGTVMKPIQADVGGGGEGK